MNKAGDRSPAPTPVVDWRADWRRAHGGLYILPGMAIAVSVLRLVDGFSPPRVLAGLLGILAVAVNHRGGRVVKPWQMCVFLALAVAFAFLAFWVSGLD